MRHVNFGAVRRVFVLAAVLAISVSASVPAADLKITNLATGTDRRRPASCSRGIPEAAALFLRLLRQRDGWVRFIRR